MFPVAPRAQEARIPREGHAIVKGRAPRRAFRGLPPGGTVRAGTFNTPIERGGTMRLTRAMMLAASCVAAAAFGINASDGAFAQGAETQSKTCRVTRAEDVEIQQIEPFKVFDNLYYVGPCYVSVWLLTTPQGHILFDSAQEPFVDHVDREHREGRHQSQGHQVHRPEPRALGSCRRRGTDQARHRRTRRRGGRRLDDDRRRSRAGPAAATSKPNACRSATWWSRKATRSPWATRR